MNTKENQRESNRNYQQTKERDAIKNNYAENHSIKLIRIPWFNENKIHEILDHLLS